MKGGNEATNGSGITQFADRRTYKLLLSIPSSRNPLDNAGADKPRQPNGEFLPNANG